VLGFLVPPDDNHASYRGRYRVGGTAKIHEVTLQTPVKEVALKKLKEIHEDAEREAAGLIPAMSTRRAMQRPILELFEEFLKDVRKRERSKDYIEKMEIRIPAVVKGCRWNTPNDITAKSFEDWWNSQTRYAVRSLNHYLTDTRTFLNWVERMYEIKNPLKRIQKLPVPFNSNGPRAFSEDELCAIYAAAPRRRFFYRFLTFTGLRHKEARRLQWGDVRLDGENPGLFLRPEATKSRRPDWLPILSHLVPELRAARPVWAKDTTPVFHRGVATLATLKRDFARAGISFIDSYGRKAGYHTFRRTFITLLQNAKVQSRVIMQLARHKSLRLTDFTYTDATKLPLREGVETLARLAFIPSNAPLSHPQPSPLKPGQNGVSVSKPVQTEKSQNVIQDSQPVASEQDYLLPSIPVQDCPKLKVVGVVGFEPTASTSRT